MIDIHEKLMILQRAAIGSNNIQAAQVMDEIEQAFEELQDRVTTFDEDMRFLRTYFGKFRKR